MRKLLIKLVAIETALLGWLSYWLFLVYADNPSVATQLAGSLQRFPQLSFSTIDIAVLVIIGALAVTLAFKFQRGLRPGIRLERALQMLENLMKRNLILESQVAELKIDRSHPTPVIASSAPTIIPSSPSDEPKLGSWEKAFKTPLEAGPPLPQKPPGSEGERIPFGQKTGIPPPRIEPKIQSGPPLQKPAIMITEKGIERSSPPTIFPAPSDKPPDVGTSVSASWEDNPQFIGETKGILTPSSPPRKAPAVSESGGLKQPYIPAPAPKITTTPFIVGPTTSPVQSKPSFAPPQPRILPKAPGRSVASPRNLVASIGTQPVPDYPKPDASTTLPPSTLPLPNAVKPPASYEPGPRTVPLESKGIDDISSSGEKTRAKETQLTRKKTPPDDKS